MEDILMNLDGSIEHRCLLRGLRYGISGEVNSTGTASGV